MTTTESAQRPARHDVALLVLLMVLVVLAAELSRLLSTDVSDMSAIWPPLGIAIGAALVLGPRALPAYALALGGWLLWRDYSVTIAALSVGEQTLQCGAAMFLLRRMLSSTVLIDNLRDTLRFYFWGALVALLPFSLLTSIGLVQYGLFSQFSLVDVWLVYWLSEALGVMLFAPLAQQLFSAYGKSWRLLWPSRSAAGFVVLLVALISLNLLALAAQAHDYGKALTYLYFPLLAWAAMSGHRWLSLVAVPLVASVVLGFVVAGSQSLDAPSGFLLVEAVLVIFMMTLMSQLVQSVNRERQSLSLQFREQARQDLRSGLLNDRGLLQELTASRQKTDLPHWVGVLELRNFDDAQDLLDIDFSNRLEQFVGQSIGQHLPDREKVARISAGVFAFVYVAQDREQLEWQMDHLWRRLHGHAYTEGESLYVLSVAIGLCRAETGDPAEACLSAAGQAARHAGNMTDRSVHLCSLRDELIAGRQEKLAQLEEVKLALNEDRFVLYCQEIRALDDNAGRPAYEVLIRMLDRQHNIVSPGGFMPVAEDYGLVSQIDRWVVEHVFRWCHEHPDAFSGLRKLSINLSGPSLGDPGLPGRVAALRQRYDIDPARIGFEVTESQQISDWKAAFSLLSALREQGFSISLDDFGTGLATFEYLTSFPFDVVKIDGRFVRDVANSPVNQAIIASVTRVARSMGLATVAEFVEDETTLATVKSLGVGHVQGYGIGRPHPLRELEVTVGT